MDAKPIIVERRALGNNRTGAAAGGRPLFGATGGILAAARPPLFEATAGRRADQHIAQPGIRVHDGLILFS